MSYEMRVNTVTTGAEGVERLGTVTEKLEQRTARVSQAIQDYILKNEKLTGTQARLALEEAKLEQLRERHRMGLERMTAATTQVDVAQTKMTGSTIAATNALRVMEGSFPIRAAGRFLTTIQGFGPVLQGAFPVIGAIALFGVVEKILDKTKALGDAWDPVKEAQKESLSLLQRSSREYDTMLGKLKALRLDEYERAHEIPGKPGSGRIARQRYEAGETRFEAETTDLQRINRLEQELGALRRVAAFGERMEGPTPQNFARLRAAAIARDLTTQDVMLSGLAGLPGLSPGVAPSPAQIRAARIRISEMENPAGELAAARVRRQVTGEEVSDQEARAKAEQNKQDYEENKKGQSKLTEALNQVVEIEKRTLEAWNHVIAREGAGAKLDAQLATIRADTQDELRKSGLTPSLRSRIAQSGATRQYTAILGAQMEAGRNQERLGETIDEMLSITQIHDPKIIKELESQIPYMAGILTRRDQTAIPGGYISPAEQLRGVRDRERRTMGMMGLQGRLAGGSESDIANATMAARIRFAEEEYQAELRIANLKQTEAEKEQARTDALDQLNQKIFDAQVDREKAILELTLRTKQEFEQSFVGLIDAAIHGNAGGWLRSRALGLGDKVIGKAAGVIFDRVAGASRQKTVSIPDVLGGAAKGADQSTDANTAELTFNTDATKDNTKAVQDLTNLLGGGSGGGGGSTSAGVGVGPLYGLPGGGMGSSTSAGPGISTGSGISRLASLAMGGFLGYEGIRTLSRGGAQNTLGGVGEIAAAAGMVLPILSKSLAAAGPIGMAAGLALGFAASMFGDPKQRREHQISQELKYNQFFAPEQINATMTTHGTYADFDRFGGTRGSSLSPFPTVQEPYADWRHNTIVPGRTLNQFGGPGGPPPIIVNVNAMNSKSFQDNAPEIAGAVHHALLNGSAPQLQQTLRSM